MKAIKQLDKLTKKLCKWEFFPFLVMFLIYVVLHCITFQWFRDDEVNHHYRALKYTWEEELQYLVNSTNGWSSRIIVNTVGRMLSRVVDYTSVFVWVILNSAFYALIARSVEKILAVLFDYKDANMRWLVVGIFMIYPFELMNRAGWLCTSVTYLWPVAIGIWFVCKYLEDKKYSKAIWKHIILSLALVYSANSEGVSILLTVILLTGLLIEIVTHNIKGKSIYYTIISICSVIWHLLSPGNGSRADAEMITWFPNYSMLGLIDKLELAFSKCIYQLVLDYNAVFIIFAFCLFIVTLKLCTDEFYRWIAALPLLIAILFSIVSKTGIYSGLSVIYAKLSREGTITVENYERGSSYLPIVLGILIIFSILITLYVIMEYTKCYLLCGSWFVGGLGSWMIISFSPSIWQSGDRPFSALYFVLLFLSAIIICVAVKKNLIKATYLQRIVWIFALFTNLNCILLN